MPGIAAAHYLNALRESSAAPMIAPVLEPRATPDPQAMRTAWLCLATPLRYVAEISNVRLSPAGILTLDAAEAALLARDFNHVWRDSAFRLDAVGRSLFCRTDEVQSAVLCDPERVLGRHLQEFLPVGAHAGALKRLMSEMEMWLFEHEVNRARERRMAERISGLWLWGGGPPLDALPLTAGGAAGEDVFFSAFAAASGQPESVIVVQDAPGTETWGPVQARWLQPALDDLQRGVISRLDLSAGVRCWHLGRRWRRRIFRRVKPWWEYFD
jgi:hypothetical protein